MVVTHPKTCIPLNCVFLSLKHISSKGEYFPEGKLTSFDILRENEMV